MMNHPEFPVVSFLMIPLLLCSLPSHIRAGSIGLIGLCLWLLAANLIHGVNSIIWAGNVFIKFEVWCDITMAILMGFSIGVPLSVLCISRQLESISSNRTALFTPDDKRRRMKVEFILCFIVPLFFMALHYVFQGHRFDIIEDIGCNPATYVSIPTIICILLPPVLVSLTSMGYSLAAVHHFLKRRIEFAAVLRSANSVMTPSRYFRLLLFAFSDIFFHSIATSLILYFDIQSGVRPYVNWQFVHLDFSNIGLYPTILIPLTTWHELLFAWWVSPVGSVLFFVLFSFGQESISEYRAVWNWIKRTISFIIPCRGPVLPLHAQSTSSPAVMVSRASAAKAVRSRPWDEESSIKEVSFAHVTKWQSGSETQDERPTTVTDHFTPCPEPLALQSPARAHTGLSSPGEHTITVPDHVAIPIDFTPQLPRRGCPLETLDERDSATTTIADDASPAPVPVHFAIQLPSRTRPFSVYTL